MLLRNFNFASKYLDFELKSELENNFEPLMDGWYKFIDNQLTALVVKDSNIYFLYGEKSILITESHKAVIKKINCDENRFLLLEGNNILLQFIYELPDSKLYPAPFDYIDTDDFKWGDFIAEIINNEEKKNNYIFNLMNQN